VSSGELSPLLYPLFWVLKRNPSKNRERGGVSALGGRRLVGKTQQPTKSWRFLWGGYWEGRATAVERVGEGFCCRLGAANKATKKTKK